MNVRSVEWALIFRRALTRRRGAMLELDPDAGPNVVWLWKVVVPWGTRDVGTAGAGTGGLTWAAVDVVHARSTTRPGSPARRPRCFGRAATVAKELKVMCN
jgi:hypothetical protein